jgi:hypothetical protein
MMPKITIAEALSKIQLRSDELLESGGQYYYLKEHYPVVAAALRAAVSEDALLDERQVQYVTDLVIDITLAGESSQLNSRLRILAVAAFINGCR